MRAVAVACGFVSLLIGLPDAAAQSARSPAVDIDLGTATLESGEITLGPFQGALGLGWGVMVGTYVVPWSIAMLDQFSIIPNGFVKVEAGRFREISIAAQTSLFHAKLNDLDEDGLNARAIIWSTQLRIAGRWDSRWSTTLELTGVFAHATADKLADQDTEIYGVAIANTFHVGLVQRFRWTRSVTLWARERFVLERAPVQVQARAALQARANSAELSSVGSGMVGIAWTWRRMSTRLGIGYGHWILPWVLLPVGENLITGDLDLYFRF